MIRSIASLLILSLCSCGLVRMPFKVVGGVTRGTAEAVSKPIESHKARKAEKERQKAKEEAQKKKEEAMKNRAEQDPLAFPPSNDGFPDLDSIEPDLPESIEPDLPPLPAEYQDPEGN